jgi:hypothetical protein
MRYQVSDQSQPAVTNHLPSGPKPSPFDKIIKLCIGILQRLSRPLQPSPTLVLDSELLAQQAPNQLPSNLRDYKLQDYGRMLYLWLLLEVACVVVLPLFLLAWIGQRLLALIDPGALSN